MDPITLLATASAIWSGLKKASEFAAEAEGVWALTFIFLLLPWLLFI